MSLAHEQLKVNWKRNTFFFLSSQILSLFGSNLVLYALMWHITLTAKSGTLMMLFVLCGFIPTFLLTPFAGVWADRYSRKMLIVFSDALVALATLILALVYSLGYESLVLFLLMTAIRAIGSGIQMPAVSAILPQIVPEEQLTRVNGINGSLHAFITILAPMSSATLLTMTSLTVIFLIDVFTAILAILTLLLFFQIPLHAKAAAKQTTGYFKDLVEGIKYIRSYEFLKTFFLFFALLVFLLAPATYLTPLQVARSFGEDVWQLTAIEITFAAGMMLGGGFIAAWGNTHHKISMIAWSTVVIGVCTIALGVVPVFWLYLSLMTVFGIAWPFFNTPAYTLLQEKVEENYLGRVFGVLEMISNSMMPVGMLVFGPMADVVKIEWLLMGTGLFIVILGIFLGQNKGLVEAGKAKKSSA